jgi:hypothetical protein
MRKLRLALVVLVAGFALAQAVAVQRTNPPVESEVKAPPAVMAALRKACWDCHSNETDWPWYASVAPMSWVVAHDVNEGRGELNFSRWSSVDAKRLEKLGREIAEDVQGGDMPPLLYRLAHRSQRPTDADRAAIVAWARTLGGAPGASSGAGPPAAPERATADGEREEHDHRR